MGIGDRITWNKFNKPNKGRVLEIRGRNENKKYLKIKLDNREKPMIVPIDEVVRIENE